MHIDRIENRSTISNQIQRQTQRSPSHTPRQTESHATKNKSEQVPLQVTPLAQDTFAEDLLSEHPSYEQFTLKFHIFLESIIMHCFRTLIILNHAHKHPEQKAHILVHIRILNFMILIMWCQCCSHVTSWHTHHVVINDSNKTKIIFWDSIIRHKVYSKFHEIHSVVSKGKRWDTHQQYGES